MLSINLLPKLSRQIKIFGRTSSTQVASKKKYVLGCGSNVVDNIYNVKVVPKAGEKGFFMSPFKALEAKLIGGVTLNHLSWAALAGVPAGLMAFQGNDHHGQFIRSNLKKMGVTTEFIKVDDSFITSECHVFIQEDGERSILQAPAASFLINSQSAREAFEHAIINHASMVTTEISQIPFAGVLEILKMAKEANVLSILDLDIPPYAGINEAKLGGMDDLLQCIQLADVLKPAKAAGDELLQIIGKKDKDGDLTKAAASLIEWCGSCKLVAITDGGNGSILATPANIVKVDANSVTKVTDTTGAGDAFLGGLITGISKFGLPTSVSQLEYLGRLANAFGAAGVQSVGGVPVDSSKELLQHYLPDITFGVQTAADDGLTEFAGSLGRDATAASQVASSLNFTRWHGVLELLTNCTGQIYTSGIGKSGIIASRLASSLSSIGVPSHYVNACEWFHGELGKLIPHKDVCIFLSHGGHTNETLTAAQMIKDKGITTIAITGTSGNPLGEVCQYGLDYSNVPVKEPFDCLPTTSLIVQEMLCNAVICELINMKNVSTQTFTSNHPGGTIGLFHNNN